MWGCCKVLTWHTFGEPDWLSGSWMLFKNRKLTFYVSVSRTLFLFLKVLQFPRSPSQSGFNLSVQCYIPDKFFYWLLLIVRNVYRTSWTETVCILCTHSVRIESKHPEIYTKKWYSRERIDRNFMQWLVQIFSLSLTQKTELMIHCSKLANRTHISTQRISYI